MKIVRFKHFFENFMLTYLAFFNLIRKEEYVEKATWGLEL